MSTQTAAPDILEELLEETSQEQAHEPPFRIVIHNDEVTPYDFVILILQTIFHLAPVAAELVTFAAHTTGHALVAVLPKPEAQRRVGKAHFAAQLEGYPLTFTLEPDDN